MDTRTATADDRAAAVADGVIRLDPGTRRVELTWRRRTDVPALSYDAAVRDYTTEYRRRWETWIRGEGR